jgi:integrase
MLATGLRIGEALAVTWSDVDLDAGTVEVDWKLQRIKGEGLRRVQRLTSRDLREARDAAGFGWVTSHVFRKTCATILDEAGLSARDVADQLGHAMPSMTQDVYMGRKIANLRAAAALEALEAAAVTGSGE